MKIIIFTNNHPIEKYCPLFFFFIIFFLFLLFSFLFSFGIWNRTEYRPLEGFVLAISPFNFIAIAANLTAAPGIMGNVSIWKPASNRFIFIYLFIYLFIIIGAFFLLLMFVYIFLLF